MDTINDRLRLAREYAGFTSAAAAARAMGLRPSTYGAHENGQNGLKPDLAQTYAKKFGVRLEWLLTGDPDLAPKPEDKLFEDSRDRPMGIRESVFRVLADARRQSGRPAIDDPEEVATIVEEIVGQTARTEPNVSFPPRYQSFPSSSVPLLGQSSGGANGRFILNGQEIGRLFCPPSLEGVEGAYAVRVYGTSMEPRFRAGEAVWLNPRDPIRSGDDVVVQVHGDEDTIESYIKEFVSRSSTRLRLKQLNPDEGEAEGIEFPSDRIISVHKVVFHAMA